MRRISILVAVTITIFTCTTLLSSGRAYACSCAVEFGIAQQERAEKAFSQAGAVFAGRVADIEDPPSPMNSSMDPVTVTFKVSEVWKGPQSETLEVTTATSGASCGYEFRAGKEYLVYTSENLEVFLCGETKPLSEAKADLEVLGTVDALPDTSGAVGPPYLVPYALVGAGLVATLAGLATFFKSSSRRRRFRS